MYNGPGHDPGGYTSHASGSIAIAESKLTEAQAHEARPTLDDDDRPPADDLLCQGLDSPHRPTQPS